MGGRFLNKRFSVQDGFSQGQGDDSPAFLFEGGTGKVVNAPFLVEGALTVSGGATVGSAAISNVRVGSSVGNDLITAIWKTTYTWNIGAIGGVYGSTNSTVTVDVAMSGASVGDWVRAAPIGSFADGLIFEGSCMSANAIHVRAAFNGTTGAYTPGNVPLKIITIKI